MFFGRWKETGEPIWNPRGKNAQKLCTDSNPSLGLNLVPRSCEAAMLHHYKDFLKGLKQIRKYFWRLNLGKCLLCSSIDATFGESVDLSWTVCSILMSSITNLLERILSWLLSLWPAILHSDSYHNKYLKSSVFKTPSRQKAPKRATLECVTLNTFYLNIFSLFVLQLLHLSVATFKSLHLNLADTG